MSGGNLEGGAAAWPHGPDARSVPAPSSADRGAPPPLPRNARNRSTLPGACRPPHGRPCPAPQAGGAREWLEIAQRDIKVMRLCHKNGHYGAAAYHCQQALEKIVKFAVVKYSLLDNPADLNHDVVLGLLLKWKEAPTPEHPWARGALELACKLLRAFAKSSRNAGGRGDAARDGGAPSPKDALWAASLGKSVYSPKLCRMSGGMKAPPKCLLEEALAPHLPKKTVKEALEGMQNHMKKGEEALAIIAAYTKIAIPLWEKFQKAHKPRAGRKRLDQEAAQRCLLLWLLANLDTLLKAAPHEEYGRYPGTLCGKPRAEWYAENPGRLLELEESASGAFCELHSMIKY